jgi:protein-S-isoprenylcysteine O-methyltransferase Ste14
MLAMLTGLSILACWVFLVVYWNISARSIKPAAESQDWSGRLARMPIWLGYILFIFIWVWPFGMVMIRQTAVSGSVAVAICALGMLVSIWSRRALGSEWSRDVELKQGHKLVEGGPYAIVRHPIYTGHLLMGLGTAIGSGLLAGFVGLALFLVGFWIKLRQEERLLVRSFPEEYPAYRARVRALIPYVL